MDISVSVPLDPDGFVRRQCPGCDRQFKWFHGRTEGHPEEWTDPGSYNCPYCGVLASVDSWNTEEQVAYAQQSAFGLVSDMLDDAMKDVTRKTKSRHVKLTYKPGPRPSAPQPMTEPNDMTAIASPCHPFEPVKVRDDWEGPFHCLICGSQFAVS